MAKTTFDQTSVTNVSSEDEKKLRSYATTKKVMLFDFPAGTLPTKGSIDHCAKVTEDSKTGTTYALYLSGKTGLVYVAMQRGNGNTKVVRDASTPYTVADITSELEWLLPWINSIARPNMPFKAVKEFTVKGNVVNIGLSNGQLFTLTIAETKTSK